MQKIIITDLEMAEVAVDLNITDLIENIDVCLFFLHLEEMFRNYPNGFARHSEPRKDQQELSGLSWTEELGTTKHFVKKHFKRIGVHYPSREEYERAKDKFQGKYYCSVYEAHNHRRTFYYRNNELFDELRRRWHKQLAEGLPLAK